MPQNSAQGLRGQDRTQKCQDAYEALFDFTPSAFTFFPARRQPVKTSIPESLHATPITIIVVGAGVGIAAHPLGVLRADRSRRKAIRRAMNLNRPVLAVVAGPNAPDTPLVRRRPSRIPATVFTICSQPRISSRKSPLRSARTHERPLAASDSYNHRNHVSANHGDSQKKPASPVQRLQRGRGLTHRSPIVAPMAIGMG